ncbi:MAG: 16S rRNA (cytosine(1402)-N(4))-methyltransferase RsmH, partial [Planctomycetes bacterium]|nr:16S rRNA (cytosine(1402)-N(4))-methyltransferase RsmH [Planctomycetota bacterium]
MNIEHIPVLVDEVLHYLDLRPGLIVVDGTVGAGGHARRILEQIEPDGTLIGLDRDPMMLDLARQVLPTPPCHLYHASYSELAQVLKHHEAATGQAVSGVDRILLDLGLSSDQLADPSRGFSFTATGPLDLRFDPTRGEPAWKLLERLGQRELERIFSQYGEERFSRRIARRIVERRRSQPVRTAADLVQAVEHAVPARFRRQARRHSATRVFQALRIVVNDELGHLERALAHDLYEALVPGGRLVVISFHSLEDRIVKNCFRDPARWERLTPKPVPPT